MSPLHRSVTTITTYAVITRTLGFFFRIYLAAKIGAMMLGVYQVAFSFFIVLLGIVSSGVPLVVSADTARYNLDPKKCGGVATSGLIISAAVTAIVVLLIYVCKVPICALLADTRSYPVLLMLTPALVFSGLTAAFRGSIWGRRHYKAVSRIELTEQLTRIISCVLMFEVLPQWISDRASTAALAMSIGCAVSGLALTFAFFMDGYKLYPPCELKPLFTTSTPITVVHVASSTVNLIIALIMPVRLIAGGLPADTAMTLFGESVGMGLSLIFIPLTLTGSLSMALVPELADNMQTSSCTHVRELCSKGLNFAVLVAGIFVPIFIAMGNPIGMILFGSTQCGDFLTKGAIVMIPIALEQIASSMMNSLGLEKRAFFNFTIGTAVLLLLLWFLTPILGVDALIISMFASYSVSMFLHTVVLRQRLSMPLKYLRTLCKVLASILPAALIGFFVYNLTAALNLWGILLTGLTVLLLTGGGYLLTDVVKINGMINRLKKQKTS